MLSTRHRETSLVSDVSLIRQTDQTESGSMWTSIFFSPPGGCYVDEDIDLFLSPRWMLRIAYTYGIVRYTSPLVGL